MTWREFGTFLYGCAVELTWWAARPLNALLNRGRKQ